MSRPHLGTSQFPREGGPLADVHPMGCRHWVPLLLLLPLLLALRSHSFTCIVIHMFTADLPSQDVAADALTDHLLALHAEFAQTVEDMTVINATGAAAAYYRVQRTCARFLTTSADLDVTAEG